MIFDEDIYSRAVESARIVVRFRQLADRLRVGGTVAGCDRRQALKHARQCEGEVFNLGIKAENIAARDADRAHH